MTKQKIFFSYSRVDGSAFALRLAVDLKKKGFDVWIDQQDIRAGLEWDTEIQKALVACDCVLFLETEKSVVSNHVLDEVYYALENNKKVIPLIYVDSKTPFRLNRLQHIDFTKSYDSGLTMLVHELEGSIPPVNYHTEETQGRKTSGKSFFTRKPGVLLAISVVVLVAVIVLFMAKNKEETSTRTNAAFVSTDTGTNETGNFSPDSAAKAAGNETAGSQTQTESANERKADKKKNSGSTITVNARPAEQNSAQSENLSAILAERVAGEWKLVDIVPKAQSHRGYLKIEASDETKATIKSYMQFYYPEQNASSYLTIFNAFAGCGSCVVNREMKLVVEDIAVGSRTIKKLEEDQADGRKAGEVIMDANSNKSVRGTATLKFTDDNNAVITVKQPLTIALANDFMLEPFVYTFRFKKND